MNSSRLVPILLPLLILVIFLLLRRNLSFATRPTPAAKPAGPPPPLDRATLFADGGLRKLGELAASAPDVAPWSHFEKAAEHLRAHDNYLAIEELRFIADDDDADSRARLWAWNALRELHQEPDAESADVARGVILEVPVRETVELLATYADGSVRYLNHSGRALIWERRDGPAADLIRQEIEAAQAAVGRFPSPDRLPAPPSKGSVRISLLTFRGVRSRELTPAALDAANDPAGPLFRAATRVLQAITAPAETQAKT